MGQLFNSSENVSYRYQPLFSYAFKNRLSLKSTSEEIQRFFKDLLTTEDDFVLQRGRAALAGYELQFKKNSISHLVYKEVRYHDLLEIMLERIDKLTVVGIVRNPCAVIHSWINAPREFDKNLKVSDEWRTAPAKNKDHPENWYGFERWKELATLFHTLSQRFPSRFHLIRYEELIAAPKKVLSGLFDKVGITLSPQVIEFAEASCRSDDTQPYGVFRDWRSARADWREQLDRSIIEEIQLELRDSDLSSYLLPVARE